MINKIIQGHALNVLPKLPAESVSCVTCSPPYWGLRDYGIEPVIWDGDKDCEHEWNTEITKRPNASGGKTDWAKEKLAIKGVKNYSEFVDYHKRETSSDFCSKCGAWRGSLGLEPTFELYIKHLCDIFDKVKRVLRKDGTCWVNIGDSYWGGSQGGADYGGKEIVPSSNFGHVAKGNNYLNKSLCDIPYRFSIEMINRGWIKRNTIIWWKPNCMPSSADDRFTVDFEYLFFFTKNNKAIFWTNEKTLECVDKRPLGIKGIEGKDWEWRKCTNCHGTGQIIDKALKEGTSPIDIGPGIIDKNTKAFRICPRCKGSGKVKYSFWSGHDYWFEQQFEKYAPATLPRMDRGVNINKWTFGADGQTPHNLSRPRLNKKRGFKNKPNDHLDKRPMFHGKDINYGKQGRNKRCVWIIPTQPFPEAHFAVYPETLIETPIKAGCPEFICKKCGKARVNIYERQIDFGTEKSNTRYKGLNAGSLAEKRQAYRKLGYESPPIPKAIGYSDCGCNADFESGIVLDPFMGSGTTAREALKQRKRFIGIEIKQEYIDMSYRKIAKVQQEIF